MFVSSPTQHFALLSTELNQGNNYPFVPSKVHIKVRGISALRHRFRLRFCASSSHYYVLASRGQALSAIEAQSCDGALLHTPTALMHAAEPFGEVHRMALAVLAFQRKPSKQPFQCFHPSPLHVRGNRTLSQHKHGAGMFTENAKSGAGMARGLSCAPHRI